jgi:hypothetical protein
MDRRSSTSTATWAMGERRGGPRSRASPTNSPSWPGTHRGRAGHPIRRNRSASTPTPTAWRASRGARPRGAARGRAVVRRRARARAPPPPSRRPRTPILGSAYAGWAGSLPATSLRSVSNRHWCWPIRRPTVGALLPTMFSDGARRGRSPRSGRACCGSIRRGSGRWRAPPPRTCATCFPGSRCTMPTPTGRGPRAAGARAAGGQGADPALGPPPSVPVGRRCE